MNRTLACTLCITGIVIATASCSSFGTRFDPTPTPTQIQVSTPFSLTTTPVPKQNGTHQNQPGETSVPSKVSAGTHMPSYSKTLLITQVVLETQDTGPCSQASAGNPIDVTIPDNTVMKAGEHFVKTWRLVNSGPCTWSADYTAIWFSGDRLGAASQVRLPGEVLSGNSVDISVDMTAPDQPGLYQSNWKLSNDLGELFGIGPAGDAPIWVRIIVDTSPPVDTQPAPTPTAAAAVLVSGVITLMPGEGLDLDTNRISDATEKDLVYSTRESTGFQLLIQSGVEISDLMDKQPGFEDCTQVDLSAHPLEINDSSLGGFFCYKTNLGLPGWGHIVVHDKTTSSLTLEILTWSVP